MSSSAIKLKPAKVKTPELNFPQIENTKKSKKQNHNAAKKSSANLHLNKKSSKMNNNVKNNYPSSLTNDINEKVEH